MTTAAQSETKPVAVRVYNMDGDQVGSVEIDPEELGGKINKQLLHDAVLMYLANRRAGTHSTKRRGEVAGSTRKLFRQKGTGRARVGNRRTNKRRGGGTAKGPKPRNYEYHMPKKAVRAATRMALLSKFQDREAVVVDELKLEEIGTRYMAEVLENLNVSDSSCLIGLGPGDIDEDRTIYLSSRNIPKVEVAPASQFNTYGLLHASRLVLTKSALQDLCENLKWSEEVLPEDEEEQAEAEDQTEDEQEGEVDFEEMNEADD